VRYRFRGFDLRTENAAKPYRQRSKWIIKNISSLPPSAVVLDYGCGKFRYTIPLSRKVKRVYAVDSSFQIEREQHIASRRTTLREYARRHLGNVSVSEITSKIWRRQRFDFVLCSNVLSVIPQESVRLKVLRELGSVLKTNGLLLVSTQFRNTHFKQWRNDPEAIWIRDGWLVKRARRASFYAILPPTKLRQLCRAAGLVVTTMGSKGETGFVFAKRRR
jgi:2-polyprenyl-3-methyl-5-hydroxy-6-metoxy-1,4-benzoquinol methylase